MSDEILQLQRRIVELQGDAHEEIARASNLDELEAIRVRVLGRKGDLAAISDEIPKLPKDKRKDIGKHLNDAKRGVEAIFEGQKAHLERLALDSRLDSEWIDLTTPAPGVRPGSLHPVTQVQQELEQLFVSMGFAVLDGPEVESEYYNFDALNIPADHPARDMQDTFWLKDGRLLRTHTSPVQIRGLETLGPPLKMIAPGRTFRNEEVDASHEHTFYQLEGMMVDREVSVAHLIYFMKTLLSAIFKRDVTVRLRPGFFPFVEPGFELDIQCLICGGAGCPVCKQSGWVELLPCGLVHPAVLRHGGADPEIWGGFAFGLGLTRLTMMRYGIDDIRLLMGGDLRFLRQF
ncbi:MAG TPA: phenylalanine--tRNA ligase subunit alpha [Bryobacteraceae bacterium]|nr:phenylalanine--tRNA ligase subunit alpha [Bryobacteraceae bacterium]